MKKTLGRRIEKSYLMLVGIISLFLITGYFSYAYFTLQTEQKNRISIIVGTLNVEMKVDGAVSNKLTVSANTTKEFTVIIKNINDRTARYNFYYTGTLASGVEAGYVNESGKDIPPEAKGVNINATGTQTYKIKVKNGTSSSQTINLVSDVGLDYNDLELPSNGHLFEKIKREYVIPEDTPLKKFINTKDYEDSTEEEKKNMYVFEHEAGEQQEGWSEEELTDYRYIGSDPNNYVTFNGETAGWRIIGVFTVEDENGKKEKRIKLIRKNLLSTKVSFDNKPRGTGSATSVLGMGSSDWTDSRLMYLLNPGYESETEGVTGSIYWNRGSGNCPYGGDNATTTCSFSSTGLNSTARNMIGDAKWYLGDGGDEFNTITSMFYENERGTSVPTKFQTNWIGKVGLMYPSDYGYATGGGSTTSRTNCLAGKLYDWMDWHSNYIDCVKNDWLYDSSSPQWTITPSSDHDVFHVEDDGGVFDQSAYSKHPTNSKFSDGVRPVVYLKSSVKLTQGTGTSSNPFVFSL